MFVASEDCIEEMIHWAVSARPQPAGQGWWLFCSVLMKLHFTLWYSNGIDELKILWWRAAQLVRAGWSIEGAGRTRCAQAGGEKVKVGCGWGIKVQSPPCSGRIQRRLRLCLEVYSDRVRGSRHTIAIQKILIRYRKKPTKTQKSQCE